MEFVVVADDECPQAGGGVVAAVLECFDEACFAAREEPSEPSAEAAEVGTWRYGVAACVLEQSHRGAKLAPAIAMRLSKFPGGGILDRNTNGTEKDGSFFRQEKQENFFWGDRKKSFGEKIFVDGKIYGAKWVLYE